MKPPPRLALFPRPSRLGVALVLSTHAATAALAVWLPLPLAARLAALAAIVLAGACSVRKVAGPGRPRSIRIGIDRRIAVITRGGREANGEILDDCYVGPRLATIVWRPDGARRARTLLVLSDTLAADDFRRLRVALRYSRAAAAADGDSEVEAG